MGQVTIMTGPERRRRWSADERLRILEEACAPGAVVADVARRHDVSRTLIYGWRRQLRREVGDTTFVPAVIAAEAPSTAQERAPAIVIEFSGGRRVSIAASASPALVAAALKALR